MPAGSFLQSLRRRREISITVRGRRTGRKITLPVWFVLEDGTMWLLPVQGSRSQWFRNVVADPALVLHAGPRRRTQRRATTGRVVTGRPRVRPVVEKFREKYGRHDVARYYTRFDAAVKVSL